MTKYLTRSFCFIIVIVVLSSCTPEKIIGIEVPQNSHLPNIVRINVPHISQNDNYSCASTSAAMAISSYIGLFEKPLDKEESWIISKSNKFIIRNFGNDVSALKRLVNYYGYSGEFVNKIGIYNLKYLLSKGVLVVLFIRPNLDMQSTHAILATGYDEANEKVFIEDPSNKIKVLSFNELEKHWNAILSIPLSRTYQAGFIIYPKKEEI